ncbi:MAG: NmrA family NAD(P)-binding protein [Porticoccaceae bacterium]
MATKKIAVFGATGTSGGGAMRKFIEAGWEVRAVTRDKSSDKSKAIAAKGATVVEADLDNRATIRSAIEGCDAVYYTGPSLGNRFDIGQAVQGINAADAVAEVGIGHFIFQSALSHKSGKGVLSLGSKRAIEERLAELHLPTTITRPSLFMDNFLNFFPVQKDGDNLSIAMALPGNKVQGMVCSDDIGNAAVAVASNPQKYIGADIDLIADTVSFDDMASIIGDLAGKKCTAISLPLEVLEEHWPQGVDLYKWLSSDPESYNAQALAGLIGKPIDFRSWAQQHILPTL